MSIKFLLGVGVGALAGYSAGRILEARAHGVPLDVAFTNLGTSMMDLKKQLDAAAAKAKGTWDSLTSSATPNPDAIRRLAATA
jgi:hypothetical protein